MTWLLLEFTLAFLSLLHFFLFVFHLFTHFNIYLHFFYTPFLFWHKVSLFL